MEADEKEVTEWRGAWDGKRVKDQYMALLGAEGTPKGARELMEDLIVWPNENRPPKKVTHAWDVEWIDGKTEASEQEIRRMRQRIRAYHESLAWQTLRSSLQTTRALSKAAETGDLPKEKQVQLQYSGLTSTYFLKEIGNTFGTPRPTPTQVQQITINAGPRPPKRLKSPTKAELMAPVIDAEYSEVPVDDSDG